MTSGNQGNLENVINACSVGNDAVLTAYLQCVACRKHHVVGDDLDFWIQVTQLFTFINIFEAAHIEYVVKRLALQITEIDNIAVYQSEMADAGSCGI